MKVNHSTELDLPLDACELREHLEPASDWATITVQTIRGDRPGEPDKHRLRIAWTTDSEGSDDRPV